MAHNNDPDWGVIGGAIAGLSALLAAVIAAAKGLAGWRAQEETTHEERVAKREKEAVDHASLTLDGVFRLVNELQAEVERKARQIDDIERHCAIHVARLEERIVALEATIAAQVVAIEELSREIRELKRTPPG